jgi:hypothetical protein
VGTSNGTRRPCLFLAFAAGIQTQPRDRQEESGQSACWLLRFSRSCCSGLFPSADRTRISASNRLRCVLCWPTLFLSGQPRWCRDSTALQRPATQRDTSKRPISGPPQLIHHHAGNVGGVPGKRGGEHSHAAAPGTPHVHASESIIAELGMTLGWSLSFAHTPNGQFLN